MGDPLLACSPQQGEALIGTSVAGGGTYLVAKFSRRKNMAGGRILRRPCFCLVGRRRATSLRPIHSFRAEVRRRVAPGGILFRSVNRGNFSRMLKAIIAQLRAPGANRYISHGFRRAEAQGMKETRPPPGLSSRLSGSGIHHLSGDT